MKFTLSLLSSLLLLAPLTGLQAADNRPPQPLVGAIRWDAWTGGEVTVQVERTLGPKEYHLRMPWFAEVLDDGSVRIDGGRQAIMDQEVAFAADAGLDYWAFLLYPETSSMSESLELYLHSASRRRINFCLILHNAFGVPEHQWPRERDCAVALLEEPGYQSICGGRPLVYAFSVNFGGTFPASRFAEFLRAARQAGVDPYCVYMGWDPAQDFERAAPLGFAAVSHEHDEGGWLCPTWTPGGPPNKERLEAIGGVLNPRHPDEIKHR